MDQSAARSSTASSTQSTTQAPSSPKLPDLYALLGLAALESNPEKIAAALRQVLADFKAAKAKQDLKQAARLKKVLELGKQNLLSAERKTAYDARWQAAFGSAVASDVSDAPQWDYGGLDSLLPTGDPSTKFDLAQYLKTAPVLPEVQTESDFLKLQSLLAGESPHPTAASQQVASDKEPPTVPAARPVSKSNDAVIQTSPVSFAAQSAETAKRKPKNLAKQLRQKRDRSLLLMVGGVLASLAILLGVLAYVLNPKTPKADSTLARVPDPVVQPNRPTNGPRPRSSGLPQLAGLENLDAGNPSAAMQPDDEPASVPSEAMPAPDEAVPSEPPMFSEPPNAPTEPEMVDPSMATPPPAPSLQPAAEPTLSDAEKANWKQSMQEVRATIAQQEYQLAIEKMAAIEPQVKTQRQKDQFRRLDVVLHLAQDFHAALVEAIAGLQAGETFKVGSTEVSFRDGSESEVSIQMEGSSQTYPLAEIPVGLAFGLVDLKLDLLHGSSLAKKAGFTIVHPKSNDIVRAKARQLMQEAIDTGFADPDMMLAFDEDFKP
ncbi:MAG: hypothetical protein R3C53_15210 [Pirellulaceae bacterium]